MDNNNQKITKEWISDMGHDIKSPLATIRAMSQLGSKIVKEIEIENTDKKKKLIEYFTSIDSKVSVISDKVSELIGEIRKGLGDENIDS